MSILHGDVYLVTVVTGVLLLAAVPGDVSGAMALVAPVFLLATLPGKMAESVALVALAAAAAAPEASAISSKSSAESPASATSTVTVVHSIRLRTLAGKVANPVAAVTHGASGPLSSIGTFASKVTGPGRGKL